MCTHLHKTDTNKWWPLILASFFFLHTPEVTAIPETFGRLSHLMTITGILAGRRMLRKGQTAEPRSPLHSLQHHGQRGAAGEAGTPHSHGRGGMLEHTTPARTSGIWLVRLFSSFEVRHFKTVMSLVPKGKRFIGAKTFTVKRWFKRQTTGNISMKLKLSKSFILWIDPHELPGKKGRRWGLWLARGKELTFTKHLWEQATF